MLNTKEYLEKVLSTIEEEQNEEGERENDNNNVFTF